MCENITFVFMCVIVCGIVIAFFSLLIYNIFKEKSTFAKNIKQKIENFENFYEIETQETRYGNNYRFVRI